MENVLGNTTSGAIKLQICGLPRLIEVILILQMS